MSEWQPIASAPKDGHVLLSSPDAREPGIFIGFYAIFESAVQEDCAEYWVDSWTLEPIDAEPTHWMPLPPPPSSEEQK